MWILPNNHPLSSAFAPEYVDSKEDLKEFFTQSEPPFLWKSKPLLWKTFLLQWKRVWWVRHLSGRILKPSARNRFEDALMESLGDIRVNRFLSLAIEAEKKTPDISGLSFDDILRLYNQDGVFSKTLRATSHLDSMWSKENWKKWATSLRLVYTQRKKLERRIKEKDSSFSPSELELLPPWPTPTTMIQEESLDTFYLRKERALAKKINGNGIGMNIAHAVKQWGTPRVSTNNMMGNTNNPEASRIEDQVLKWPTPTVDEANNLTRTSGDYKSLTREIQNWTTPSTRDYKDTPGMTAERADGRSRNDQLPRQVFSLLDKEISSTITKSPARLNPAWSIQLMGTTLQKIFTVPLVTPLLNKPQNLPLETSSEKCTIGSDMLEDDWVNS